MNDAWLFPILIAICLIIASVCLYNDLKYDKYQNDDALLGHIMGTVMAPSYFILVICVIFIIIGNKYDPNNITIYTVIVFEILFFYFIVYYWIAAGAMEQNGLQAGTIVMGVVLIVLFFILPIVGYGVYLFRSNRSSKRIGNEDVYAPTADRRENEDVKQPDYVSMNVGDDEKKTPSNGPHIGDPTTPTSP